MPTNSQRRSGRVSHGGPGSHHDRHASNPPVTYELSGSVRWLDVELERIVIDVRETNSHAGSFRGRDVTVDLEATRIHGGRLDELVPGTQVKVKARLARDLDGLPELLHAVSVTVLVGTEAAAAAEAR